MAITALRILSLLVLLVPGLSGLGCSGTDALRGRVVAGEFPIAEFVRVDPADPLLVPGEGVGDVRIELVRDPDQLNRRVVAVGSSRADGSFDIMIDAFGAGWMQEEWLFRCSHPRYPVVELRSSLPSSNSGRVLRVQMGRAGPVGTGGVRMDEAERIRRELDRYGG